MTTVVTTDDAPEEQTANTAPAMPDAGDQLLDRLRSIEDRLSGMAPAGHSHPELVEIINTKADRDHGHDNYVTDDALPGLVDDRLAELALAAPPEPVEEVEERTIIEPPAIEQRTDDKRPGGWLW